MSACGELQQAVLDTLLGGDGDCYWEHTMPNGLLQDEQTSPTRSHDSLRAARHNNGLGSASAAAEAAGAAAAARRASLEAAIATQHAAQMRGEDVPMLLEDLLPLEDLHDPFLEDLGATLAAEQPQQAQAGELAAGERSNALHDAPPGVDPSDPGVPGRFSPTQAGFFGIPAYAEPASPAAAMLNNAAAAGALPPPQLPLPGMAAPIAGQQSTLPRTSPTARPPGLPMPAPVPVPAPPGTVHFGAQHAFALMQSAAGGVMVALPPAIAAAQQRAAAAMLQMQLQAQQAHMQAQAASQQQQQQQQVQAQAASAVAVAQPLPPQQQQAEKPASSDAGAGASHLSNGSNGSAVMAAQPVGPFAAVSCPQQHQSDDSSGGEQLSGDAFDEEGFPTAGGCDLAGAGSQPLSFSLAGAPTPSSATAASGSIFTTGDGTKAPAKRGGRPREKKSYDALIDPNLPIEEIRRLRRMLSNRESARRSRRRRQTQLSSLEVELEQLKSDKERLESELHQTSTFAQQLSAEKQHLLAELERLRGQLAQVSTSPPQVVAAAPAAVHMPPASAGAGAPGVAAVLGPAGMGVPVPVPAPGLASCLPSIVGEPSPVGSGRLPPFIEQAQRLANKLNQPRAKDELQTAH